LRGGFGLLPRAPALRHDNRARRIGGLLLLQSSHPSRRTSAPAPLTVGQPLQGQDSFFNRFPFFMMSMTEYLFIGNAAWPMPVSIALREAGSRQRLFFCFLSFV
jgi:hypothetical protein